MHYTLATLAQELQRLQSAGTPADTQVFIRALDNSGIGGYAQRAECVLSLSLAKTDYQRKTGVCKIAVRGGIPAILIG